MDTSMEKAAVETALAGASGVVPKKPYIQSLSGIWIRAEGNTVTFMSGDGSIEFSASCPADVEEPGFSGVPGTLLADLVKRLADGNIRLRGGKDGMVLSQGRRNYKLPALLADGFTEHIPFPEKTVPFPELSATLAEVLYCATDDIEDFTSCVCFRPQENGVTVCTIDGARYAGRTLGGAELAAFFAVTGDVLVRKRHLSIMQKALKGAGSIVGVSERRIHIGNADGSIVVSAPVSDWRDFPDCTPFLDPIAWDEAWQVDSAEFLAAMERIGLLGFGALPPLSVEVSGDNLRLALDMEDGGSCKAGGSGDEILDISSGSPERMTILPVNKAIDCASHFSCETLDVFVGGRCAPVAMRPAGDVSRIAIVMPLRERVGAQWEEDD